MGFMKKLTSLLVVVGLVFSLVGSAFAAYPEGVNAAAFRMRDLGLVQGRDGGDLALNAEITRAELVKVIVEAFGQGKNATFLKGGAAFSDTATHWASGYLMVAKNMAADKSFALGYPDGTFKPDGKITAAEAVALVMKFVGLAPAATGNWPDNWLNGAVAGGLLSSSDLSAIAPIKNAAATRGLVFYLADYGFSTAKVEAGKTVYQAYVAPMAPSVTLDAVTSPTTEAKAMVSGSVALGTALDKITSVTVNGATATVTAGKFSADVNLAIGENTIAVAVSTLAGHSVTASAKIARTAGAAASIDAAATLEVEAGKAVDLAAAVKDAAGNELKDAMVEGTSTLGTFAAGKFTAGEKAGMGTLTLKYGELTKEVAVTVKAGALAKIAVEPATVQIGTNVAQKFVAKGLDSFDNEVAVSAVTWSATGGVIGADGTFAATASGNATITAKAGDVSGTATATVYGAAAALKLSAPADLVANGKSKTTITATVVDASGNVVPTAAGKVNFAVTDPSNFTLAKSSVDIVNGVASVEITGSNTANVSAILQATASGLVGANATLKTVKQTLTSFAVSQDYSKIPSDGTSYVTLTVVAKDQAGQTVNTAQMPTVDLQLSLGGSTAFVFNTTGGAASDGKLAFSTSANSLDIRVKSASSTPASATVTGSVPTTSYTGVTANSVNVASDLVGSPYKLAVTSVADVSADTTGATSKVQTVKVFVQDYNGNTVTNPASAVSISLKATGKGTIAVDNVNPLVNATASQTANAVNGAMTFYVTDTKAEAVSYEATATWNSIDLQKVTASGNFVAGPANKIVLSTTPTTLAGAAVLAADGVTTATVTAKITDSTGNAVTSGAYEVTLSKTTDNNATKDFTTNPKATTSGGVTTFTVTSATHGNVAALADTFTASATALTSGTIQVKSAILGVPAMFDAVSVNAGATPAAGTAFSVKAEVQDANGNPLLANNTQAATLTIKDGTTTVYTGSATAVNGVVTFEGITLTKVKSAGTYDFKISDPASVLTAEDDGDTNIAAAAASKLLVSTDFATLKADNAGKATVSVKVVDAYDNLVNLSTAIQTVTVKLDNANIGILADDGTDGGFTAYNATTGAATMAANQNTGKLTFTVKNVPGSGVITASYTGLTSGTVSQSAATVGTANNVVVTSVTADVTADNTALQTIKFELRDSNGNLDTGLTVADAAANPITVTSNGSGMTLAADKPVAGYWIYQGRGQWTGKTAVAQSQTYTVAGTGYTSATASGVFVPGAANTVAVSASPFAIIGNGSAITLLTFKVNDAQGNLITTASGNMTVNVSDANFAFLQGQGADGKLTVAISGGQGTAVLQAKNTTSPSLLGLTIKYTLPGASSESTYTPANVVGVGAGNDSTAPTVASVAITADNDASIDAGEVIAITFSESMGKPTLTASNFTVTGGHSFGTGATFTWNPAGTVLSITLGTGHAIADGDTIALANGGAAYDLSGNAFGTSTLYTVAAASF